MFIAVAIYGWIRWRNLDGGRVVPRWAPTSARIGMVLVMVVGTVALTPLFRLLGSWEPVWADAWTFVGSLLATYGMAKGRQRLAEAGVKCVSLTDLDTIAQVGVQQGYITQGDVARLLAFRDDPSDENWIRKGE